MVVYVLVMLLNGNGIAAAPVTFTSAESCQKAGEAWVQEAKKLRAGFNGYVCTPMPKE
jgi:hypothetical protein